MDDAKDGDGIRFHLFEDFATILFLVGEVAAIRVKFCVLCDEDTLTVFNVGNIIYSRERKLVFKGVNSGDHRVCITRALEYVAPEVST